MKKAVSFIITAAIMAMSLAGCSSTSDNITVVSREDGSGTRGAFVELFGVEVKNDGGEKVDMTTDSAEITNSTAVMMTTVAANENAIGYISLGSLNSSVKALKIDGAEASAENIKNGSYKVSRPFNIAVTDNAGKTAKDYISYILSADGQSIVESKGYISIGSGEAYENSGVSGKLTISGSSSVYPVMEKLTEAYCAINPNVEIELQQSDSSTGISDAMGGISDIGMASRELKESELEAGLTPITIAIDGIAVVVSPNSSIDSLTTEQVRQIFTGEVTAWSNVR
ncbi:MAG: phosphate ABC transporter substrate-binding protein [Ruminococcaceae bacterium]|nr:phosphate ABC transporter substrate-binding protein [Oscillospiraceae bacterium]